MCLDEGSTECAACEPGTWQDQPNSVTTSKYHQFPFFSEYFFYCFFFSFLIFNFFPPKAARGAHFFVWLENVIFLLVIHVFWLGYFYGAGRIGDLMILARRRRKMFSGISPWKKNKSLEIANLLSCEHVSELSNGRQLCTLFSCLARRRQKNFEFYFVSKSCQLYTFLEFNFSPKTKKKKNNIFFLSFFWGWM